MGNHFRKPDEGQDAPRQTEPQTASHFAYSTSYEGQSEGQAGSRFAAGADANEDALFGAAPAEQAYAQPAAYAAQDSVSEPTIDPFAYQPANNDFAAPASADALAGVPSPLDAPAPQGDLCSQLPQIPDPMAAPEPEVTADQAHEVATLDTALQSSDFTQVFAPVQESRKKMAREAGVDPVIVMEHVTKIYPAQPNKPALEDVNIEIYPGEFVFLVGHSGSGKSTLLRTIMREVKPTQGRVMVAGQDLTRIRNRKVPYLRRQMGIVFQDFRLLPNKTAYENVAFALECIGKPRGVIRAQVPEVLRLVGLAEQMNSTPDQLSGGEQQRVNVARAMVNRPPLLICDEPTGNLDPAISLGIMKLLERINRTGTTVIVATHDREMVDSMHRRVIALEAGQVVRDQERGGYGNYGAL